MIDTNDWQPSASLTALRQRAQLYAGLRSFFQQRGVMEVETPVLGEFGVTDVHLDGVRASLDVPGVSHRQAFLQTSPEYHMKRLLAAESGPIYQIARVFRDGERGRRHNPEFSMLEWYRPGFDHLQLMAELAELLQAVAGLPTPERLTYRQAFVRHAGLDPFVASEGEIAAKADELAGRHVPDLSRDDALNLILSHAVEPCLGQVKPCFLYHYPASQAALARMVMDDGVTVGARFELYVRGIELCNGYHELIDAEEQAQRFLVDQAERAQRGKPDMAADTRLLAALRAGVPSCAGVALGLDRLLMVMQGSNDIAEVIAFPFERA